MAQREMVKTSWIYSLRKEELIQYLTHCAQDPTGTVDEMRKRFAKFVTADQDEKMVETLLGWQKLHEPSHLNSPSVSLRIPNEKAELGVKPLPTCEETLTTGTASENNPTLSSREDRIATVELVRKWGLKYDGGKEVLKFIDRLEELAEMYGVNLSDVIPVMSELLKDRALIWFRSNRKSWEQWPLFKRDFLAFFLPPRYFEKLEDEIRKRTQRPRESFKEYLLALQDLMYHSHLNEKTKLEIIFRNSLPDYQWYIRRKDFETLDDLLTLAADLECIPASSHPGRTEHHRRLKDQRPSTRAEKASAARTQTYPTHLTWEEDKLKAVILLNLRPTTATVDTGATRSFMMPSFVEQMQPKPAYISTNIEVILADGSKKKVSTAIEAPVTFGKSTKNHRFLIMEEATESIILGIDFLRAFDTTIHCAGLSANSKVVANADHSEVSKTRSITYLRSPQFLCVISEVELQRRISEFLETELPKFQEIKGLSNAATHRIVMKDDRPIKIRYGPRNPAMQAIIDEEVNSLLAKGCIEPSHSPYSFPITLVKKKNGTWRTCMDFRQLNARSVPDAYPLPRIDTILDRLRNAKYISSLDLKDGYWQIPMDEDSKKYTAFAVTGRGLYQWRVMPFGLHSAPATFQRALDNVIGPDMEPHAFAYLDDIIVIGKTFEEHMVNLREVFRRLRKANLKINVEKCEFFKAETRYLGHIVTREGIKTDPEKIAAIVQIPTPQNIREVRRFLGITSWYRRFVQNFAEISQPLTQLLKKGKHWKWGQEQQAAFETLKDCLTSAPVLSCPDFTKPFILQTDASDFGLGAVLTQEIDEVEQVIAYASRHLTKAEKNYSTTEKECLAIVWGIRKMRHYLEGYEFRVVTDHLSLKWLNSIDNPTGRLARWALELQQYRFVICYRKGKQNIVADALSRQPVIEVNLAQARPIPGCSWYEGKLQAVKEKPDQNSDYAIVNNQLFRHFEREINDEDSTPWKLCVPRHQRQQVLEETHDRVTGGHLGIRKTLKKVANRYYWPGMSRDVSRYVRKCEICQRYKIMQQPPAGKMLTRIQDEPWALVSADFVGPLPRTRHGNTMLLVLFDNFSKWVELHPLRKATAEGVVKALRERIISRYGVPKALVTDNGTQFTSRILKRYLDSIGVRQQFTAPYTPQENPTERVNRTVKTIIAQFSSERHNQWDEWLPEIMLAINTSESDSTGYSPAYLTQGRTPRLPKALYDEVTIGSGARNLDPDERANELREVFQIVKRNQEKATQKQKHHYNLRHSSWKPAIGDHVLVRQHPLSKAVENFAAKLAPKFGGPYIVVDFISPVIVRLRAVESSEQRTAHLSELKPYHTDQQIFSLSSHRSSKHPIKEPGEKMNGDEQKFERTRQKFRRNMEKEKAKGRRTIFLQDDDVPSTSKGGGRSNASRRRTNHMAPTPPLQKPKMAYHRRIRVEENLATADVNQPASKTIVISDDEEEVPPPPPLLLPEETSQGEEQIPPPPPEWDVGNISIADLNLQPGDLNDPFIQEFVRSLCGATNSMVDIRPPTPPSPPSSPSSLDWENENFRPPTPPRRRVFGTFDITDQQFPYLGMQCYERVWRARILVPGMKTTPAVVEAPQSQLQWNATPGSPLPQHERAVPLTPGRGWLKHPCYDEEKLICAEERPASRPQRISSPTRTISTEDNKVVELPSELQREIENRKEKYKGTRTRFVYTHKAQQYRITISRSGDVRITQPKMPS